MSLRALRAVRVALVTVSLYSAIPPFPPLTADCEAHTPYCSMFHSSRGSSSCRSTRAQPNSRAHVPFERLEAVISVSFVVRHYDRTGNGVCVVRRDDRAGGGTPHRAQRVSTSERTFATRRWLQKWGFIFAKDPHAGRYYQLVPAHRRTRTRRGRACRDLWTDSPDVLQTRQRGKRSCSEFVTSLILLLPAVHDGARRLQGYR